jgi:hypothetical protein
MSAGQGAPHFRFDRHHDQIPIEHTQDNTYHGIAIERFFRFIFLTHFITDHQTPSRTSTIVRVSLAPSVSQPFICSPNSPALFTNAKYTFSKLST